LRTKLAFVVMFFVTVGQTMADPANIPPPPIEKANQEAAGGSAGLPELPVVPASGLATAKQAAETKEESSVNLPHSGVEAKGSSTEVEVTLGVNEIIPISLGHLNRIVTPFAHPQVKTVSNITSSIKGPVIYVATTSKAPATMYVTDGENEQAAISLTLYPQAIPPHEIRLKLNDADYRPPVSLSQAERFERESPYVQTIKKTVRLLAKGEIPDGYVLSAELEGDRILCRDNALQIRTGQRIEGATRIVLVGVARNISSQRREIDERLCRTASGAPVLAVAAWPEVSLAPGTETELYVVTARERRKKNRVIRPSLIGRR